MFNNRYFLIVSSLLFLVVGSGCGKRGKILQQMNLKHFSQTKEHIQLAVKPLTASESREEFGRNALRKGYQPIQLTVENNSESYYILHPWYIGMPLSSPKRVAKSLHRNGFYIASAMVLIGMFGFEWFNPVAPFLTFAIPVGVMVGYNNKAITKRVMHQAIDRGIESIIIPPYGTINRFIFVDERDMHSSFSLTFYNAQTNKPVHFEINLTSPTPISLDDKKSN